MNYKEAAAYWDRKDSEAVHMEPKALLEKMEKFISAHNTCALATGCETLIRCTPIEYTYKDRKFWMLSEGGLKFQALEKNRKVCLAIYDSFEGFGRLAGMQVTGEVEMVEPWSEEYLNLLAFKKIDAERLKKMSHTLYLIKVEPIQIDFLWSGFQKDGYDCRQCLRLENLM